jgi:hypothetical protein
MKTVKFWKKHGKFYVFDGNETSKYTKLSDALLHIFLLKEIRAHHTYTKVSLYPVNTLDPRPQPKKVTWNVC